MGALGSADVTTVFHFCAYTLAVEYQGKLSIVMGQVGFPVLARTRDAAAHTSASSRCCLRVPSEDDGNMCSIARPLQ